MNMYKYFFLFFFFNDTATTEIYTLSLHDALPIYVRRDPARNRSERGRSAAHQRRDPAVRAPRSEEHTSELQSLAYLVCRLLLEKKNENAIMLCLTVCVLARITLCISMITGC